MHRTYVIFRFYLSQRIISSSVTNKKNRTAQLHQCITFILATESPSFFSRVPEIMRVRVFLWHEKCCFLLVLLVLQNFSFLMFHEVTALSVSVCSGDWVSQNRFITSWSPYITSLTHRHTGVQKSQGWNNKGQVKSNHKLPITKTNCRHIHLHPSQSWSPAKHCGSICCLIIAGINKTCHPCFRSEIC